MTTQGRYVLETGLIDATVNGVGITDPNQIAALQAAGWGIITIPDGANSQSGMIINGVYTPFNSPAAPIPNTINQLVAALINNGTVDVSVFHQATIAQINVQQSAAGLSTITPATIKSVAPTL